MCSLKSQRNHHGPTLNMHIPVETSLTGYMQSSASSAGCYSNRQNVTLLHLLFLTTPSDLSARLFATHATFQWE